ncbi:hypothetical protein AAVH_24374 [Aphelenchoides avenae]|nr:hypothetical protein AAVH_24374 [Aphelenchus avenae]
MCIFPKVAECERLHGANVGNNDAFRLPVPIGPFLPPDEGVIIREMFRRLIFQGPDLHRDTVVVDSLAEKKPKEKKRERRAAVMATGMNATKQAKKAEQRRVKLQYKTDRRSKASRRLPARFVRR